MRDKYKGSLPHGRTFDTLGTNFECANSSICVSFLAFNRRVDACHMPIIDVHTRANQIRVRRAKMRACGRPASGWPLTCMPFCHAWHEFHWREYACHRSEYACLRRVMGMHMHIIGVHMHIIGVHTLAKKIRVRRAKVRACGRPA